MHPGDMNHRPAPRPSVKGWKSTWRQLVRLPATLVAVHRIVREDGAPAAADEHLWAFRGFHLESWDPHYRARPWRKARLAEISPADVVGLCIGEMAFMMHVAMEIEDPILEYSHQNGEGFRLLLPALGRFMGKNDAEAAYARQHGVSWCESPWCAEERRHGNAFAKVIERLTNASPPRDNPNAPRAVTADEDEALSHLVSRQAAEWSSSSTYVVMAAHARGSLHTLIRNIARDEIKHLCILSAADVYLLGPRPWRRLRDLIRIGLTNYRDQRSRRSSGADIGANSLSALEVIAAHLLVEHRVRRWLRGLPLGTLATVFETPSNLPELAACAATPAERIDGLLRRGWEKRRELARWAPAARQRALQERQFDDARGADLARIIESELDRFRGAEVPGSAAANDMRRRIARGYPPTLRRGLLRLLRDHQIRNNRHVLARDVARGQGRVQPVAGL